MNAPRVRLRRTAEIVANGGLRGEVPPATRGEQATPGRGTATKVLAVGFYPPPIDGQRLITQRMHDELTKFADVFRHSLDPAPRLGPFSKALSVISSFFALPLARVNGCSRLYFAPHSGTGLLYSSIIAGLGRALGFGLYVHYHSFKNMSRRSRLMALFVAVCGPRATHIVLGQPMADGLRSNYPGAREIAVLSNAVFMPARPRSDEAGRRIRLGHLSNLSRAKGLDAVVACMRALLAAGIDAELVMAGPATNEEAEHLLAAATAEFGDRLTYLGWVGQEDLPRFYESIDVFLFPTRYEHEAEPLVIIEALSFGVPVLATDRGCIGSLIGATGGFAFPDESFEAEAIERLRSWAADPAAYRSAVIQAHSRFLEVCSTSRGALETLISAIVGRPAVELRPLNARTF